MPSLEAQLNTILDIAQQNHVTLTGPKNLDDRIRGRIDRFLETWEQTNPEAELREQVVYLLQTFEELRRRMENREVYAECISEDTSALYGILCTRLQVLLTITGTAFCDRHMRGLATSIVHNTDSPANIYTEEEFVWCPDWLKLHAIVSAPMNPREHLRRIEVKVIQIHQQERYRTIDIAKIALAYVRHGDEATDHLQDSKRLPVVEKPVAV